MPSPAPPALHPLHALLLAFPIVGFSGGLAFDITYMNSPQIQWTNFAAWLIAAGTFFGGLVLAWAAVALVFRRGAARLTYTALVALMFLAGLINSFQHSKDGWSSVGAFGVILSLSATVLGLVAGWIAHSAPKREIGR